MTEAPSTPVDFDETEMNYELTQLEDHVKQLDRESLESIVMSLSRRLGIRFTESRRLSQEAQAWRDTANNQAEVIRELKARSLATLQMRVHDWRKKAYPDTRGIELQALGVAEESGELCHAVLKFKQGIRGYDFEKTHDEVGDAIGDIIIYAMGVADQLDISIEEALYKTVEHVINRNITQGSDAGVSAFDHLPENHPAPITDVQINNLSVAKFAKGDRIRVADDAGMWAGRFGTVHPAPGVDPHHPRGQVMVMLDGKDSPWSFDPTDLIKIEDIGAARIEVSNDPEDPMPKMYDKNNRLVFPPHNNEPKGVDYAGHVPEHPEGPSGVGCFLPAGDNG